MGMRLAKAKALRATDILSTNGGVLSSNHARGTLVLKERHGAAFDAKPQELQSLAVSPLQPQPYLTVT